MTDMTRLQAELYAATPEQVSADLRWLGKGRLEAVAARSATVTDLRNALSVLADAAEARGIPCDAARAALARVQGASA